MARQDVEQARERQRLIAANRAQRNAQRQEMMASRREIANNAYLTRMQGKNAQQAGADPRMVQGAQQQAMLYGDTIGGYQDRRQGYLNQGTQRQLMNSQGYAARTGADAQYLGSEAAYRGADAQYLTAKQMPEMQQRQITSDERIAGGTLRTQMGIENSKRQTDVGIAQANRDALIEQAKLAARLEQMRMNQPIVTESGILERDPNTGQMMRDENGNLVYDSFGPDPYEAAELEYRRAPALLKVWKDPFRALAPLATLGLSQYITGDQSIRRPER